MKFFYVYVLHNPAKNFIYIGYSENLKQRFQEHNSGKVKSTQFYKPLKLIFYEAYFTRNDAKRREKYFKTNKGKTTFPRALSAASLYRLQNRLPKAGSDLITTKRQYFSAIAYEY